jgi:hypothetical protein
MEPPGTAVRTAVSPGHARPSGPKLWVLSWRRYALTSRHSRLLQRRTSPTSVTKLSRSLFDILFALAGTISGRSSAGRRTTVAPRRRPPTGRARRRSRPAPMACHAPATRRRRPAALAGQGAGPSSPSRRTSRRRPAGPRPLLSIGCSNAGTSGSLGAGSTLVTRAAIGELNRQPQHLVRLRRAAVTAELREPVERSANGDAASVMATRSRGTDEIANG